MASVIEKPNTIPSDPVYLLTIEQYRTMIRTGILTKDDAAELLNR